MTIASAQTLFFINWTLYGVALLLSLLLAHQLFKSLKRQHPKYYESIGKPRVQIPMTYTEEGYSQAIRGRNFMLSIFFRGLPDGFPRDAKIRKQVQVFRIVYTIAIILFIATCVSIYIFDTSTT